MTATITDVISNLNDLIETCKDGQQGYLAAAGGAKTSELRRLFDELSLERSRFAGDLQAEVTRLGGDPAKSGTVSGALHRGWLNIKKAVSGADDHAILEECERGEDSAVQNYREALSKEMPADLRSIVVEQYETIQKDHNQIRSLRDARVP